MIRIEEIGDTWVKLLWSKGAEHNSPILYYTIQTRHYWALYEDDWRNASTCEYRCSPTEGRLTLQFKFTPEGTVGVMRYFCPPLKHAGY